MLLEINQSILFSDTLIPDIFISEYLPILTSDQVKIYVYVAYLSTRRIKINRGDMLAKLGIEEKEFSEALLGLEALGLITQKRNAITICDVKEKELNKLYRPKMTSTPEEAEENMKKNIGRLQVVKDINNRFFQGLMPPSMFTDIDSWFDRFGFEVDVMMALFQHCYDHKALNKNYILVVAQDWHVRGIRNCFDLDKYFIEYSKYKDIRKRILKTLKMNKPNHYEEKFIKKWVEEYKYPFEIIELALRRSTRRLNVGFDYLDAIITEWHNNGLKTVDEVANYEKNIRKSYKSKTNAKKESSLEKRGYDDTFMKNLYE